jgi:hypothetical protein
VFVLGVVARGWETVVEFAGRCSLGTLLLHDEPDDDRSDQAETDKTPNDTSNDGPNVGFFPSPRVTEGVRWKGTSPGVTTT